MPFRVSGKNIDHRRGAARPRERADRRSDRQVFRRRLFRSRHHRQGRIRLSHRMRDPSRFRHRARSRGDCRRRLFQRRSGRGAHRKAAAPLQAPAQGSSRLRARTARRSSRARSRRRAMSSLRRSRTPTRRSPNSIPVIIAEINDHAETYVGERCGHATRPDRHRGGRVSARWTWPRQSGLSPRRRPYRLDRSAGRRGQGRPKDGH